jgi:hypothetical protein
METDSTNQTTRSFRNDPLVSGYLMGGLGNQLFQIFTTMAYGLKYKRKILFPYSDKLETGITRPTYWESFLTSLKPFTTEAHIDYHDYSMTGFPTFCEEGFRYKEIPDFAQHRELLLFGYYQSYKYFESQKATLFKLICLEKQQETVEYLYPQYIGKELGNHIISMHFRLGDYKNIQDCHPLMPVEYYRNALIHVLSNRNKPFYTVIYFCEKDDIGDVLVIIEQLRREFENVDFMHVDETIPDWQQMLMMSCCNDNIIANSSFSWWGAYFNPSNTKIVCYPSQWFGSKLSHDTSDMCPSEWKRVFW